MVKDPLYRGTTSCFMAWALYNNSFAGVTLTGIVWGMYFVILHFEDSMLEVIYPRDPTVKRVSSDKDKDN